MLEKQSNDEKAWISYWEEKIQWWTNLVRVVFEPVLIIPNFFLKM